MAPLGLALRIYEVLSYRLKNQDDSLDSFTKPFYSWRAKADFSLEWSKSLLHFSLNETFPCKFLQSEPVIIHWIPSPLTHACVACQGTQSMTLTFPPVTHLGTIVGSCALCKPFNQRELVKCQYGSRSLSNFTFPCPPISTVSTIRILHQKTTGTEAFVNFPPFVVFLLWFTCQHGLDLAEGKGPSFLF